MRPKPATELWNAPMIHETGTSARAVRHDESFRFKCARCGGIFGKGDGCGTGYAVRSSDDALICYACCGANDARELAEAKPGDRFTHYLTYEETAPGSRVWWINNWPGTLKIRVGGAVKRGRHNIGRTRMDAWFSYAGKPFHAVNIGDSQIAHIRALKP